MQIATSIKSLVLTFGIFNNTICVTQWVSIHEHRPVCLLYTSTPHHRARSCCCDVVMFINVRERKKKLQPIILHEILHLPCSQAMHHAPVEPNTHRVFSAEINLKSFYLVNHFCAQIKTCTHVFLPGAYSTSYTRIAQEFSYVDVHHTRKYCRCRALSEAWRRKICKYSRELLRTQCFECIPGTQ